MVLDYNFNNRFDQLEQIDEKDRARCEVLVNACCTPKCKRRGEHYRSIGLDQIAERDFSIPASADLDTYGSRQCP